MIDLILHWPVKTTCADFESIESRLKSQFSSEIQLFHRQNKQEAIEQFETLKNSTRPLVLITKLGHNEETLGETVIDHIRQSSKTAFIIIHSHTACSDPNTRWYFASRDVNMITQSVQPIFDALTRIIRLTNVEEGSKLSCPYCGWKKLSIEQLRIHVPFYHTNRGALRANCDICLTPTNNFSVHIVEEHDSRLAERESAVNLYAFSLVVCQRKSDQKFLVVQESGSMGFWLPGGRVEVGETLQHAGERETLEEAGVRIRLTGVLKFEFTPRRNSNRLRVIFFAEPFDENDCEPKTIPDYESFGAIWVTYEQVLQMQANNQLRGYEPLTWFKYILDKGIVHPLSIF